MPDLNGARFSRRLAARKLRHRSVSFAYLCVFFARFAFSLPETNRKVRKALAKVREEVDLK
jgi:hypothetical protein